MPTTLVFIDGLAGNQALWTAIGAGACVLGLFALALGVANRRYRVCEARILQEVRRQAFELRQTKHREEFRNRVLAMLVSSHPLGVLLEGVAELASAELIPAGESAGHDDNGRISVPHCVILLKSARACHVAAAPGVPSEWLQSLRRPCAVPFEVWKDGCEFPEPAATPAWNVFFDGLIGARPGWIKTIPVPGDSQPCAVLLLAESAPRMSTEETLAAVARMAQLAIEHSRLFEELQHRASHDSLTGLPNRQLFEDRLGESICEAGGHLAHIAVLALHVGNLKELNDCRGHRAGDLLLMEIASRLQSTVRQGDTVARLSGSEFSILVRKLACADNVQEIAERIALAIRVPWVYQGHSVTAAASIGLAIFPEDGGEVQELQRAAGAAMYYARGLGGDRIQAFGSRNDTLDRVRMDQELRTALREERFTVHYQPQIGAAGQFLGLEALVRLNHPERGQIPPMQFIPVAEESGLIVPLGAWVLNEVCRQIADWERRGFRNLSVAVNVSPVQISRPDFTNQVRDCLERHGVLPARIELELTESLFIGCGQEAQRQMESLRSLGLRLSIDDFGTGYSALSYLHKLEVDAIKLDRSFVQSIDSDANARRLVQAMIGVAQGLGLNVVAEGVETEGQLQALIAAGCPMMQGYLFSRPVPASDVESFLNRNTSAVDDIWRLHQATAIAPEVLCGALPV